MVGKLYMINIRF